MVENEPLERKLVYRKLVSWRDRGKRVLEFPVCGKKRSGGWGNVEGEDEEKKRRQRREGKRTRDERERSRGEASERKKKRRGINVEMTAE